MTKFVRLAMQLIAKVVFKYILVADIARNVVPQHRIIQIADFHAVRKRMSKKAVLLAR